MRGHITKRGKNSWTIVLSLGRDLATGKYGQQWVSVQGTRKDAERKLAELLHQVDTGGFVRPARLTVGELLKRWLKDYVWSNLAPKTAEGYEHIVRRHLVPALGSLSLTGLKPEHLQRYYSEKLSSGHCKCAGGLAGQTVRHHHTVLHKALQTAVEWGLLSRNVADAVRPPRVQRREMHIWDEDDITRFLEAAKGTPYHALFYLALFTGMRRSELLALRWQDVDFILSRVCVSRSLHRLRGGSIVFRSPKTAKGRRTVALPPSAILLLKEHWEKQKLERAMVGEPLTDDDLVFSHLDCKPLLPDSVTHAWVKLVRRVGLRGIRLHDARHSHASLMLKHGVHPKVVQERLGHSSIQITLDTYSHVAPGLQEAAAKRFDEAFTTRYNDPASEKVH